MAGAGYNFFGSGDVLGAGQVNTYLQEQVIMVFDNASARTSDLAAVVAEGMVTYLKSTNKLQVYDGAAWVDLLDKAGDTMTGDLQVDGTIRAADGNQGQPGISMTDDPDTGMYRHGTNQLGFASGGATRMVLDSNGSYFYQPVNAQSGLQVTGDAQVDGAIRAADGNQGQPGISMTDDPDTGMYRHGTNQLGFASGGATRMVLDSNGSYFYQPVNAQSGLQVTGDARLGASDNFKVSNIVRSTAIRDLVTASGANMHVAASNGSIYRSTSSSKYKSDVETLDDAHANIIFEMRPVWYRSTTGNDPVEHSYYGLIAEEVAEVDPRLVVFGAAPDCSCDEDEDGAVDHPLECLTEPEGVYYERFVPHLINLAQRQQSQIDVLMARIDELETRLDLLETTQEGA